MARWLSVRFLLALMLTTALAKADPHDNPTLTTVTSVDILASIQTLGDPDPIARSAADDRLHSLGISVRPQLIGALDSCDPEIRTQAAKLLLHLLWAMDTDAEEVRQKLANYGDLDADARCEIVLELAGLPNGSGNDALARILVGDPSAAVRWRAANELHSLSVSGKPDTKSLLDKLQNLLTETKDPIIEKWLFNNAPLLAVTGWTWRDSDANRAGELLSRAAAIDIEHPSAVNGEADFVYLWLIDRTSEQQRYSDALKLLREQAARTSCDGESLPDSVGRLFALHAEHGPFPGMIDDLRTYRAYLDRPETLYAVGRLAERHALSWVHKAIDLAALALSGDSQERHYAVASFLIEQGWLGEAEGEVKVELRLSHGESINVYFQLASIAAARDDDVGVARAMESALKQMPGDATMAQTTRYGEALPWTINDAWAEVHWHYLRAARSANDLPAVQIHLEKLMELDKLGQILHKDPGLAADIVPALRETGRQDDAKKCFDAAYKDLHGLIAADPNSAEAKNNLAWLCASCGWKLDEALKLASEAIAAAPDNAAYLDTAAEANFRAGKTDEAVKLETRALQLKAGDTFIAGQLEKFSRGAKRGAER